MNPIISDLFGNLIDHFYGQKLKQRWKNARQTVAKCLSGVCRKRLFLRLAVPEATTWRSGGLPWLCRKKNGANRLLVSPDEHHAVSKTAEQLRDEFGFELDYLPVDEFGRVDPKDVLERLDRNSALVSVIYANNEIGERLTRLPMIGRFAPKRVCRSIPMQSRLPAHLPWTWQSTPVSLMPIGAP